jgi:DNA-directed RNA polymerase specialized sigma24 family protein
MNGEAARPAVADDVTVVRDCILNPSQRSWDKFFRHFEVRFRKWIQSTLRGSSEADWEDTYQVLAEKLLSGKVLPGLDLNRNPEPYLRKSVENLAHKRHEQAARHAEEQLDDMTLLDPRLQLIADQALPASESEVFSRLTVALKRSNLGPKRLKAFSALLEHKTLKEIAEQTGFSKSSVDRYVHELEAFAYDALDVPFTKRKKT